ncbi:MAG: hypothetical protein Q4Q04_04065 [Methanocorpusculum sp.]|nr:hypothetical protein [Methanocorpusculum sp.]
MNKKRILPVIILALFAVLLTAGCVDTIAYPALTPEMDGILDQYIAIQKTSETAVADTLTRAAKQISALGYGSEQEREILRTVYTDIENSVAVSYYNAQTKELIYVPWTNAVFKAEDIAVSGSEKDGIVIHGPFTSDWYGQLISVSAPVYADNGAYIGRTAAYFRASELISIPAKEIPGISNYSIAAVNTDGTFLYATHNYLIGTNINNRTGEFTRITNTSGTYRTITYNAVTREYVGYSALWKTETVCGTNITYLIGTTGEKTNYSAYIDPAVTIDDLTEYVQKIYFFADHHTREETIQYITNLEPLTNTSIYPAFAISFDGTMLAMTENPETTGMNMIQISDSYTKNIFSETNIRALQGGGYVHFFADDKLSAVPNEAIFNIIYVIPVGRDYYVGASIPASSAISAIDHTALPGLRSEMNSLLRIFYASGKEKTLSAVGNADTGLRVTAVSYSGICLADNRRPEAAGTNIMDITNQHNDSMAREMIMIAKNGGGLMYFCTEEAGSDVLYLCYIQPIQGDWLICAAKEIETMSPDGNLLEV